MTQTQQNQKEGQPPLSASMQQMEGVANEPDSPYQSVANLIDAIANYIYQHRNEPNLLEYFSDQLRESSGILANSALVKADEGSAAKSVIETLTEMKEKMGPTPASTFARREQPGAEELSVRANSKLEQERLAQLSESDKRRAEETAKRVKEVDDLKAKEAETFKSHPPM